MRGAGCRVPTASSWSRTVGGVVRDVGDRALDKPHLVVAGPRDEVGEPLDATESAAGTAGGVMSVEVHVAADAEHRGGGGGDDAVLGQLDVPVLGGAVGAGGAGGDLERAVGDRAGEVHREGEWLAQTLGVLLRRAEQGCSGDAAERAHHVRVGRVV